MKRRPPARAGRRRPGPAPKPAEGDDGRREQAAAGPRLSPSRAATAGETPLREQLATSTRQWRTATAAKSKTTVAVDDALRKETKKHNVVEEPVASTCCSKRLITF
jgi:hypothetical protein